MTDFFKEVMNIYRITLKVIFYVFAALMCITFLLAPLIPGIATYPILITAYLGCIILLDDGLRLIKIPFSHIIAVALVLCPGIYFAYSLNKPILDEIKTLEEMAIPLESEIETPETIAIYSADYDGKLAGSCNPLCQRLLYNEASKHVLILDGPVVDKTTRAKQTAAYSLAKQNNCLSEAAPENLDINVKNRIAAGECIEKSMMSLTEADLIFIHGRIDNKKKWEHVSQQQGIVYADYFELYKKQEDGFEKIFRDTKIWAKLVFSPIIYGPKGHGTNIKDGIITSKKNINGYSSSYGNLLQNYKSLLEKIFGNSLNQIARISTHYKIPKRVPIDTQNPPTTLNNERPALHD